jgi:hypothetical protein
VHHGEDWADFLVPREIENEEMKFCRAIGGRFPTKTLAWLRWVDGRETRSSFRPENGNEFEWFEGGEEQYLRVRNARESQAAQEQMQSLKRQRAYTTRLPSETSELLKPEKPKRKVQIPMEDTRVRIVIGIRHASEVPTYKLERLDAADTTRKGCVDKETKPVTVWIPGRATPKLREQLGQKLVTRFNPKQEWWITKEGDRVPEYYWPQHEDRLHIKEASPEEAIDVFPRTTFVRVQKGTDTELEVQGHRRMTAWRGHDRLDIWAPKEGAEVGEGEIEEIIWRNLDTSDAELS